MAALTLGQILNFFLDMLVEYYFGDKMLLAIFIILGVFVLLVAQGFPFTYAGVAMLPLVAAFTIAAWMGSATWLMAVMMIAAGVVYAQALIKLYT